MKNLLSTAVCSHNILHLSYKNQQKQLASEHVMTCSTSNKDKKN